MSADTPFWWASAGKAFTATAILQGRAGRHAAPRRPHRALVAAYPLAASISFAPAADAHRRPAGARRAGRAGRLRAGGADRRRGAPGTGGLPGQRLELQQRRLHDAGPHRRAKQRPRPRRRAARACSSRRRACGNAADARQSARRSGARACRRRGAGSRRLGRRAERGRRGRQRGHDAALLAGAARRHAARSRRPRAGAPSGSTRCSARPACGTGRG